MPEIRQNIATKEWVIIATERARRPEQFVQPNKERVEDRPIYDSDCPFCPGNEELDLERLRLPQIGDWQVRVVQNRYPALLEASDIQHDNNGINGVIAGIGYHEVVVESRQHNTCPALSIPDEIENTLLAFRLRGLTLRQDQRVKQLVFFKNHGPRAGASLLHPHTQLVALPVVPYSIRTRMEEARRYFEDQGECVICCMRRSEERDRSRIVAESAHFSAFVPYAAYSPFHLWIIPRRHASSFLDITPDELHDLSRILRDLLRRIYIGLNDPDYNYVIRSAPEHELEAKYVHWYLSIIPRVTRSAGFELSTGMFINTALPEESAHFLRTLAQS